MIVTLLVILHVIVCLFLVGVVLLQQGKNSDVAGAFGGQGSQTAFGPRGASNLLTRLTTWGAVIFMLTSVGLTISLARSQGSKSVLSGSAHPQLHTGQEVSRPFHKPTQAPACVSPLQAPQASLLTSHFSLL